MAILRKKKTASKREEVEIKNEEIKTQKVLADDSKASGKETENKEVKTTGEKVNKPKSMKKGSKVTANGRCFGSESLECPLKTVRNYETKILEVSEKAVLIDEGWISKNNLM